MIPTASATASRASQDNRDINLHHKFVSPEGMHVFPVMQSFNRTCRKLGLVPWMCVEKIAENPNYNIFEAGPEMARAPAPPVDAPESDTPYADQALVEHPAVGESAAGMERPLVGAPAAPPDQSPVTPRTPAGDKGLCPRDITPQSSAVVASVQVFFEFLGLWHFSHTAGFKCCPKL